LYLVVIGPGLKIRKILKERRIINHQSMGVSTVKNLGEQTRRQGALNVDFKGIEG